MIPRRSQLAPVHASHARAVVLACVVRGHELCGHRDQLLGLVFDVPLVVLVRLLHQLDIVARRPLLLT